MEVSTQIRQYLATHVLYTGEFPHSDDTSLLRAGIIDSLGVMELVAFVQAQFGIRVDTRDITPGNFDSIACLSDYVKRKRADQTDPPAIEHRR